MKRTFRLLFLLSCFSGSIWAQSVNSSMDINQKKDAKGNDEITFTLLFSNSGNKPVSNVEVALSLPPGLPDLLVQVLEKSLGPISLSVDSRSTVEARILRFKAKNIELGRYNPNDPNTQGRITIKTNLPSSRLGEVKATVKMDEMTPEEIKEVNVFAEH
jgi:uncharacterized repeat protein (TIGR01451 family)